MVFLILIIGLVEAGAVSFLLLRLSGGGGSGTSEILAQAEHVVSERKSAVERAEQLLANMVELPELRVKVKELIISRESLKAERGRVTITQAELETIENRLRELDEIARELEASAVETREEVKILERKERDLNAKNAAMKDQIAASLAKMEEVFGKLELNAQVEEQVNRMKADFVRTEEQVTRLLTQIQGGNEQYFILKKRYDALDIEYAQLYEKFSEQQAQ